jgi:hypothetical protein
MFGFFNAYPHRSRGEEIKQNAAPTFTEAARLASNSLLEHEFIANDRVETVDSLGIVQFMQQTMNEWIAPEARSSARMVSLYLDNEPEPPSFLIAAQATLRDVVRIVHVSNPSDDALRGLQLDPATTFFPKLVAYVPSIKKGEEEEAGDKASRGKKGKHQHKPPMDQMSFHVVGFDTQMKASNIPLHYETSVLFLLEYIRIIDQERWDSFIENVFPVTTTHELSKAVLAKFGKLPSAGQTWMPKAEVAFDSHSLERACPSDASFCLLFFYDARDKTGSEREAIVEQARKGVERSAQAQGVRFTVIDGSCHSRVVEAFGGDPAMLPFVSAWSRFKNGYSTMKGTFSVDTILSFVKNVKRGSLTVQKPATDPFTVFTDVKDCEIVEENSEGEDDLLKEMLEEAEKEVRQKELARKSAEEEAKRLKEQRENELKAQREKMNRIAEEERLARKKAQQDLDEERLAKKKEQQKLDEERLAAKKAEETKQEL